MTAYLPLLVIGLALGLAAAFWLPLWRMRMRTGTRLPDTLDLGDQAQALEDGALFYFMQPRCGACARIAPLLESLRSHGETIVKVDISRTPELARCFGIRVVPAVVRVRGHRILAVYAGPTLTRHLYRLVRDGVKDGP